MLTIKFFSRTEKETNRKYTTTIEINPQSYTGAIELSLVLLKIVKRAGLFNRGLRVARVNGDFQSM